MPLTKQEKREQDALVLRKYEAQLRGRRVHYSQEAETYSTGGQRNRAMAAGAAVLEGFKMLDKLRREHPLVAGTLSWIIGEDRCVDPDGKKGYKYTVAYHVYADEPALTEEEIQAELKETKKRIWMETEEMYAESGEAAGDELEEEPGTPEEGAEEEVQAEHDKAGDESAGPPWVQ